MDSPATQDRLKLIMSAFKCGADVAHAIDARANYVNHPAQATIFINGDDNEHACMLMAGRAQAVSYSATGQIILLYTYAPGDVFGEGAALGTGGVSGAGSQVITTSKSEIGHFSNAVFVALIEQYSAVALAVTRLLTQRLGQTTQRMIESATLSTPGRINAELLRQARLSADGKTIKPAPILSEFALLVQSTRESVSRTINQLEKRGIIQRSPEGLVIIAPHRLEDEVF
jgi:CRP/FNR family transcriptional regulator, cyclic AMP receptor protein